MFSELIRSDSLFWFCALAGSGMFLIQFIVNMFGMSDHDSFDTGDTEQTSADVRKFKWFSLQTIAGFLMMFGWTAITCQDEFGLGASLTIVISLASGLLTAFIVHSIFKIANKLRSPGSLFRIEELIGKEGYVYQCIPKGGKGKVSVSLHNFTYEIDAISCHDENLPSFMGVKIIEKKDDYTVVVAPL